MPQSERNWIGAGSKYLQDTAVTLELAVAGLGSQQVRRVKIYGSPQTPELGSWAFQYPPIRDVWTGRVPDDTDILVVHGPPALYGDSDGERGPTGEVKMKGDGFLLREIRRVKPKMVVCGHIHGAFGLAVIQHDGTQDIRDGLQMQWEGYDFVGALKQTLRSKITATRVNHSKESLVVNAAVAPGVFTSDDKPAIAIDFYC